MVYHVMNVSTTGTCKAFLQAMPTVTALFQHIAIDLVGLPRRAYGYLLSLKPFHTTAEEVSEDLLEIFSRNGVPDNILSDQGSQFKNLQGH